MPSPTELVQQLEAHKGFRLSAVYVWGTAPFRPDDEVYELVRAEALGERLDLVLKESGRSTAPEVILSVDNPGKLKVRDQDLRISSATKVSFAGVFEATLTGDTYRITRDGKPGDEFQRKDQPAVRLSAAISLDASK